MLGSQGFWASSKGMVLAPNLFNLTNTDAIAAIQAAGLVYSGSSSTNTSNPSLSNKVASQIPNANDLVDYESSVSFIYYNYVPATTTTQQPTSPPDNQDSYVTSLSPSSGSESGGYTVTINGYFPSTVTNVSWNGVNLGSFSQNLNTITFTAPSGSGSVSIQVFNGKTPLMSALSFTYSGTTVSTTTTTTTTSAPGCLNTYSFTYYDGACNYAVYNCNGEYIGTYRATTCDSAGTDSSGATKPGCSDLCSGSTTTTTTTTTTQAPGAIWYCSIAYYDTQIPNEYYEATSDESSSLCGSYNLVCSQSGFPTPSRPPACSTTTTTTTTAAPTTWYCTTSVSSNCAGCTYNTYSYNASQSGSGYTTTCNTSTYPACQTPCVTTTTTTAASKLTCPGTITNPFNATCSELGLTRLGGSDVYDVPSGWSCCGDAISTTSAPATTTQAPATTTAAPTTTATPTTTSAPTGYLCTSMDVAIAFCSSTGCDNSGCGGGGACSNPVYRGGIDC